MREGLEVLAEYNAVGGIAKGFIGKIRKDIVVRPKAAVCPECGEVCFYLENVQELRENTRIVAL